jgi:hypothetical protein
VKEVLKRMTLRSVMLKCVAFYLVAVIGTVIVAHVSLIFHPAIANANLSERLIAPVRGGLEFLDSHWKGSLLIVAPFLLPAVERLIDRIRQLAYGDAKVDLVNAGVHEKPRPSPAEGES